MKYYHVNDGSIVTMPFEFSLEGGLFYDDSRELPGEDTISTVPRFL